MKSILGTFIAAIISLTLASPAHSSIIQYNITFDGSTNGPAGSGSFIWDTSTNDMSTLLWSFEDGVSGGITELALDEDIFFPGTSLGEHFFNHFTGIDGTSFTTSTAESFMGPFDRIQMLYGFPSRYEIYTLLDAGSASYQGTLSVQAVALPAAFWLFGSGLLSLIGFSCRKK